VNETIRKELQSEADVLPPDSKLSLISDNLEAYIQEEGMAAAKNRRKA